MKYKHYLISLLCTTIGLGLCLQEKPRQWISQFGTSQQRQVLASLKTSKLRGPYPFEIIKLREGQNIWLDVYFRLQKVTDNNNPESSNNPSPSELVFHKKLPLKGGIDGHILIQDQASNLALANIDADKNLEIIAPTYDHNMQPILNIYKYDPILEEFHYIELNSLPAAL